MYSPQPWSHDDTDYYYFIKSPKIDLEKSLSRIIQTDGVGKERTRLTRAIVLSIRELLVISEPDESAKDIVSFIILALEAIAGNIDNTVTPWEKRGYWLKADKFRLKWEWTEIYSNKLRDALFQDNWAEIAMASAKVGEKLTSVQLPKKHKLGKPWVGAWQKISNN